MLFLLICRTEGGARAVRVRLLLLTEVTIPDKKIKDKDTMQIIIDTYWETQGINLINK